MRLRAKVDRNQPSIVQALRNAGCDVQPLHQIGKGCPDLLVGRRGHNLLIEVKMPRGPRTPGPEPLTDDQEVWHRSWRGQVAIVTTVEEALQAVGLLP